MSRASYKAGEELAKMNMHEFKTLKAKRLGKFGEVFGYILMCIGVLGGLVCYYIDEDLITWAFIGLSIVGILANLLLHKIALKIDEKAKKQESGTDVDQSTVSV